MPNELPLPPRVADIDSEIQTLRLLKDGLDAMTAVRQSLDPAIEALGTMKSDLKGEILSFGDVVTLAEGPKGEVTVKFTDKVDPLKLDKTQAPRTILNQAIEGQKALENLFHPFAESHSTLLKSMEKMANGMDKSSELFGQFQDGLTKMKKAWDLFDKVLSGKKLEADELIEAFDGYFSGMLETFADTIGKVPGMGPFLEQYAKAIKSIVPNMKTISEATKAKNEIIRKVFGDAPPQVEGPKSEVKDQVVEQSNRLGDRIEALEAERWDLLDAHQKEQAERAVREVDGLESAADVKVRERFHHTLEAVSEAVSKQQYNVWISWPTLINSLRAKDPNDPKIAQIEQRIEEELPGLRENWNLQIEMKQARVEEIEKLIRANPHILQNADLLELQNRYPQLEDAINDIRAGNPMGTVSKAAAEVTPAAPAAAPVKKTFTGKVKAAIAGGVAALTVIGGFLFTRGSDCPEPGAFGSQPIVLASGQHVIAAADPCPDQDVLIGDPGDDPIAEGGDQLVVAGSNEDLVGGPDDSLVSTGDPEEGADDEGGGGDGGDEKEDDGDDEEDDGDGGEEKEDDGDDSDPGAFRKGFFIDEADRPVLLPAGMIASDFFPGGLSVEPILIMDPAGGWIYSISGTPAGRMSPAADLLYVVRLPSDGPLPPGLHMDLLGNTVYECGLDDGEMVVVCPDGDPAIPNEPLAIVMLVLDTEVVGAEDSGRGIWAFVADADGETANDWVPQGSFDWDYFQGTDTWFQLQHDFETGSWSITVSRVDSSQIIQLVDLPVRAVIRGNTIAFIVPESSVPVEAPYRVSAFVHDGTFQPGGSGGDVPGDDPTEALLP